MPDHNQSNWIINGQNMRKMTAKCYLIGCVRSKNP